MTATRAEAAGPLPMDRARMMSRWWIAGLLVAAGAFVVVIGLLDDLVRVAIWEVFAAVAILVWYGPARRL